ncbi:MAG: DUF1697 domain-containing protein [Bacteroidota bacterium]
MNTYIALLRGINVSGQKIIKMEALKKAFESLNYKRVTTYIQSGNVVFGAATANTLVLRTQIEKKLLKSFGFEVSVIVKTVKEIEEIIKRNPFKKVKTEKGERLHVSFLSGMPTKAAGKRLTAVKNDVDEIRLSGSEVYILCRNGYGKSLFTNTFVEKKLAVSATTRNWDTVQTLLSLGSVGR